MEIQNEVHYVPQQCKGGTHQPMHALFAKSVGQSAFSLRSTYEKVGKNGTSGCAQRELRDGSEERREIRMSSVARFQRVLGDVIALQR